MFGGKNAVNLRRVIKLQYCKYTDLSYATFATNLELQFIIKMIDRLLTWQCNYVYGLTQQGQGVQAFFIDSNFCSFNEYVVIDNFFFALIVLFKQMTFFQLLGRKQKLYKIHIITCGGFDHQTSDQTRNRDPKIGLDTSKIFLDYSDQIRPSISSTCLQNKITLSKQM